MAQVAQLHSNIDKTRYYTLKRENTLGRSPDVDLYFDNKRVSRHHAKIACVAGADSYYVEDICGRGVYVNFKRVRGRTPLQPGDRITLLQFRNIHPLDLERMTEKDLKDCCDDIRNKGIQALVDLTFLYAEAEGSSPARQAQASTGLLGKLKSLLGK